MRLTFKAFLLMALGAIPFGLGGLSRWMNYVAAGYLLTLGLLCLLDYKLTGAALGKVRAARIVEPRLSLGVDNPVLLEIENGSPHRLEIEVRDEFPVELRASAVTHRLTLPPESRTKASYLLRPPRRGSYRFGDLHLRCRGVLGLIERYLSFPAGREVKVYPNVLEVRRYESLARRGMLGELGIKARLLGEGTEFESLREYLPDDDPRRIDWKATARRGRPIVRQFEAERSRDLIFMIDCGRLMSSPLGDLLKLDYAVNAIVITGYIGCRRGDRIGALAFSDRVIRYIPPRPGKPGFYRLLENLYDLQPELTEPNYEEAFRFLASKHRKRSLIVLFTDLAEEEAAKELLSCIRVLAPHHLVVCVTLIDSDVAAIAQGTPSGAEELYQRVVAEKLLRERERTISLLAGRGVIALDVLPEELNASLINKYLEIKARSMI